MTVGHVHPVHRRGQTWEYPANRKQEEASGATPNITVTSIAQPSARSSSLAPFRVRSFQFQWPADLTTSWAFEMETIILGWYVLVETGSVFWLTVFGSLQYLGTLVAPMFGVYGARLGYRTMLCAFRVVYTVQAAALMTLALLDALEPIWVFTIAAVMGIFRPSDLVMRFALIGQTIPLGHLTGAMGVTRTTTDSARVAGALAGVGTVAAFGLGYTYVAIVALYAVSFALTLGVARKAENDAVDDAVNVGATSSAGSSNAFKSTPRPSPWRDLGDVFVYVWRTPHLLAAMCVAFLVNLTAFPMTAGLLPYAAKEVYGIGQTGLGWLAAAFSFGALIGSLVLSRYGGSVRCGRWIITGCAAWYVMLLVFGQLDVAQLGIPMLMLAGCAQSFGLVPMSAMLVRTSDPRHRGGVLGLRMLAIYGLPLGLLAASPLIEAFGYAHMVTAYTMVGLVAIGLILWRWHDVLWPDAAPANAR